MDFILADQVLPLMRDLEGEIQHLLRRRPLRSLRTTTHRDPYSVNYQTTETTTIEHPTPYLGALKSSTKPTTTQPTTEVTKPVPDQPNDFLSLPTREVSIPRDSRPTVSPIGDGSLLLNRSPQWQHLIC
jgi:hypothetical protein